MSLPRSVELVTASTLDVERASDLPMQLVVFNYPFVVPPT
jgi:hypothetical protein